MRLLRQSTSVDVPIGPFVDQTDGFTAESGLTITQPDIRLKKNGGAWAQKNASQTLSHEENGNYEVTLDATDTNTLGLLRLHVNESGALPIWEDFMVVTANVWDSFFSTDFLQVDSVQWLGVAPLALSSQHVQTIANGIGAGALSNAALTTDTGLKPIRSDICTGGANGSITLDVSASSVNDFYKGTRIYLTLGTGAGQSRICTAYNGTTKVATIEPNWITNPANGATSFAIREDASTPAIATGGITSTSFTANAIDATAIASNAVTAAKIAADAITAAKVADGAIDAATMAADMNQYGAKVWLARDGSDTDKYEVAWYKNGQLLLSGITLPKINVFKSSDGTDLIAETAMTEIGSKQRFKYEEATNKLIAGDTYFADVQATIDGSVRTDTQPVMRDSA